MFLAQGVAATSLEDITSRAGVSKGLFYLYFRSKDELFVALQDEFSIELSARIRAAADAIEDWPAKLDACVQVIFDHHAERHDLHEVLFRHGGPVSASHHPGHELAQLAIRDILADGTAAGAFDVEDPAATAALCWASRQGFDPGFHGHPEQADKQVDKQVDEGRLVRAAKQLFRRAAGLMG